MKLAQRLSSLFPPGIKKRGSEYFEHRRVEIQDVSDGYVTAIAAGSDDYCVELVYNEGTLRLELSCECPYFYDMGPCKHIWATILMADAGGLLPAVAKAAKVVPVFEFSGEPDDDDDDVYFDGFEIDYEEESPEEPFALIPPPLKSGSSRLPAPPVSWTRPAAAKPAPAPPAWRKKLADLLDPGPATSHLVREAWSARRQLIYVIDGRTSSNTNLVALEIQIREQKRDGTWTKSRQFYLTASGISELPDESDRRILSLLIGGLEIFYSLNNHTVRSACTLPPTLAGIVMPVVFSTGRCFYREDSMGEISQLEWDGGEPWDLRLAIHPDTGNEWAATAWLSRARERLEIADIRMAASPGYMVYQGKAGVLRDRTSIECLNTFRRAGRVQVADAEKEQLLEALLTVPDGPVIEVPEELSYERIVLTPLPVLRLKNEGNHLGARLFFRYEDFDFEDRDKAPGRFDSQSRRLLLRDREAEAAARDQMLEAGVQAPKAQYSQSPWELAAGKLPGAVRHLTAAGWQVLADGKLFRRAGAFQINVSSGIDWFELRGEIQYEGGISVSLPALLEAVKRKENTVRLGDGSFGVLPEEWLKRVGALAGLGDTEKDHVRFRKNQAGLLDAMLAAQPEASFDETFDRIRRQLRDFEGVRAADQPAGFCGELRHYQREGLGWLHFLNRFGFGGCLADDMGVGKTAQVLALLEHRRTLRTGEIPAGGLEDPPSGPSLVVVPRSLVFNWMQEAARFTPRLRVLDHTGHSRGGANHDEYDVVLATYGTLRRDLARLRKIEFDYIVLDEAQAIKNATTESAKAVRLLNGRHRLAMSGTPIENHLGELWSLFEFLNPGMLGAASVFKLAGGAGRNPEPETRSLLAHALRPFILRRTKEQVAAELPAKSEQTIFCEMERDQSKLYDELRKHYRNALLKRVERDGLGKSKIQVLEALLRLRQAACHPGLLDPKRGDESSAKLGVLMERLSEVIDEGHKALVFSQFTSLLAIVRKRLDAEGTPYEYLDGSTRDRQACVERFQNDGACRLFLISLKAGGLGLNLTAADYVFLLDPWWNPAAEAQAVDRAHRIGQTRQVFAYRLIARGTVEEKVLELQNTKRELAAAIISEDNSVIRDLCREDLELLLS